MVDYGIRPVLEEALQNPRRKEFENYALRHDVYDLMFRFTTDILSSQPADPCDFMLKWATLESKKTKKAPPSKDPENIVGPDYPFTSVDLTRARPAPTGPMNNAAASSPSIQPISSTRPGHRPFVKGK